MTFNDGEAFVEVVHKLHRGINEGDEDAVIVVTYIGDKDPPITRPEQPLVDPLFTLGITVFD
ncbi:hypothetical protein VCRA2110O318_150033 [Vibrio crassostreae]|nr:hypothetical protein VCRA2117O328_150070 [Vibrio crassostreae]CAK2276335.1 hypothetical protein VCRA2110O318_150033 [Vibrio crassostreae]CAK2412579.1 hypothetical protein VCRA2110O319_140069 [Vibrio crassostreae]CAK2646690.1 hypothetical protein VCRA217O317_150034 [Vibrio crassostreae]